MDGLKQEIEKLQTTFDKFEWKLMLFRIERKGSFTVKTSFCQLDNSDFYEFIKKVLSDTNYFFFTNMSGSCPYRSGMDAKAKLIKIEKSDSLIKDSLDVLLKAMDDTNLDEINPQGYILYGQEINNSKRIYFISKTNPLINTKKKSVFFKTSNNDYKISNKNIYSFSTVPHIIIVKSFIYASNLAIFEDTFNLMKKIVKLALENKEKIATAPHLPETFKDHIKNIKKINYRNIVQLNESRLEQLKTIDKETAKKYNLDIENNTILADTPERIEQLEQFLFNKLTFDLIDNRLHKTEFLE